MQCRLATSIYCILSIRTERAKLQHSCHRKCKQFVGGDQHAREVASQPKKLCKTIKLWQFYTQRQHCRHSQTIPGNAGLPKVQIDDCKPEVHWIFGMGRGISEIPTVTPTFSTIPDSMTTFLTLPDIVWLPELKMTTTTRKCIAFLEQDDIQPHSWPYTRDDWVERDVWWCR